MSTDKLLFLNEDRVRDVLSYDDLIPAIRQALIDFSAGRIVQPLRTVMSVGNAGWFGVMPAVYGGVMGAKMVSFYPGNAVLGKHTHMAMIQLFRSDTGEPLAVMDGRLADAIEDGPCVMVAIHMHDDDAPDFVVSRFAVMAEKKRDQIGRRLRTDDFSVQTRFERER